MSVDQLLSAYFGIHQRPRYASLADLLAERSRETSVHTVAEFVTDVLAALSEPTDELAMSEGTYEMANVRPEKTGLPFIVYISEKGNARHSARVKIAPGPRANNFIASVSVEPEAVVVAGELTPSDLTLAQKWIELNRDTILGYWNGTIAYTEDALAALKPLPKS